MVECRSIALERRVTEKMVPATRDRVDVRNRTALPKESQQMKPTLQSTAGCGTARLVCEGKPAS